MRKTENWEQNATQFFKIVATVCEERKHRALRNLSGFSNIGYRKFDYRLPLKFEPRGVFLGSSDELRAELFSDLKGVWPLINDLLLSDELTTRGGTILNLYPAQERQGFRIDVTLEGAQAHNPLAWPGLALWLVCMLEDMVDTFEPIFAKLEMGRE